MSYFTHILHELQVNGQTVDDNDDFNVGEDTPVEDTTTEAPADAADNAAAEETAAAEADTTETNDTDTGDEEDDFTLDDGDEEDTEATEDDTTDTGKDTGDEDTTADEGDDDFTMDDNGGGDSEEGGDVAEGDGDQPATDNGGGNNAPAEDPTDNIDDDDKRAAEEAIYDSLTDDQKRIRVLQLKIDYKDLYETIINTMEGINGIPKTTDNLDTIKRLITFLTKAKNILIDYVENNFDNNSYLENYTMYIKYLAIFRTTAKVVEELNTAKED